MAECVEDAFRYSKLVCASITYNADIFPFMKDFLHHLAERNFQNRTVAFIENGSWAPSAKKAMCAILDKCKKLTYAETSVLVKSALNAESAAAIEKLAEELAQ
jgi:flavorubredoxin